MSENTRTSSLIVLKIKMVCEFTLMRDENIGQCLRRMLVECVVGSPCPKGFSPGSPVFFSRDEPNF